MLQICIHVTCGADTTHATHNDTEANDRHMRMNPAMAATWAVVNSSQDDDVTRDASTLSPHMHAMLRRSSTPSHNTLPRYPKLRQPIVA